MTFDRFLFNFYFSPNWFTGPKWSNSRNVSLYIYIYIYRCVPFKCIFLRPLIGPQSNWSFCGLLLVNPSFLPYPPFLWCQSTLGGSIKPITRTRQESWFLPYVGFLIVCIPKKASKKLIKTFGEGGRIICSTLEENCQNCFCNNSLL